MNNNFDEIIKAVHNLSNEQLLSYESDTFDSELSKLIDFVLSNKISKYEVL